MTVVRVEGRSITVAHVDKVLFADVGLTKGDLIDFYRAASPRLLVLLRDRPLVLHRYPDGVSAPGFIQHDVDASPPSWVARVVVAKEGGTVTHVVGNDEATLVYLANLDCVELHPWLATRDDLTHPDRMVLDLDPSAETSIDALRATARALRDALASWGVTPFLMTTGSRGYHVVVPLTRRHTFDEVRAVARAVAERVAADAPDERTVELARSRRGGRLFIDYLRNGYAQTSVAPYSLRARPGAPMATPLAWSELAVTTPTTWTWSRARDRFNAPDPWAEMAAASADLTRAQRDIARTAPPRGA
jgi:bifunctional non-homologous end joining protein LigD